MNEIEQNVSVQPGVSSPIPHFRIRNRKKVEIKKVEKPVPSWRGHGGRHPTASSVEFDRQLDKISIWLEDWNHTQRCQILEALLRRSNHTQFQFLHTALQPALHRDFLYTAQTQFPSVEFKPVSTHASRQVQQKLILHRQDNFYRMKSAHFQDDDQVIDQVREKTSIKFPAIPNMTSIQHSNSLPVQPSELSLDLRSVSPSHLPKISANNHNSATRKSAAANKWKNRKKHKLLCIENPEALYKAAPSLSLQSAQTPLTCRSQKSTSVCSSRIPDTSRIYSRTSQTSEGSVSIEDLPEEGQSLIHWYTNDWSDVRRNEFLHKFVLKLDPRQHYFISTFLSVRQQRDFIALLPEKIALKILRYLSPLQILHCTEVCKAWNIIANSNSLWRYKCKFIDIKVPITSHPNWKHIYRDNMYLAINWKNGTCRVSELKGHTAEVESIVFNETMLASGSQDRTIKLWDIKSGNLLQTLKGHDKGVWCLNFFTKNLLISGSHDGTIKVWNIKTGACLRTLLAHDGPVWAMVRYGNVLVSVSQDRIAKVWDISRCLVYHTLIGHNAAIFAVDMNEDGTLIITGSADRSIRLWELASGKCIKVIWASQTTSIMAVSYSKGFIACSYGETICLYRVETGRLVRLYEEHHKRVETLRLHITDPEKVVGSIISAGKDGLVKKTSIQTFQGNFGAVKCIQFDDLRIASGADEKIRILDFNIGPPSLNSET
ncbi:hypothetical protein KUTeg_011413 [Tegillarca granosa]|uniref:F-box domain-containing protein n=1 Tax=Tegillarca granosa TaxID=220873 RepID=A0ABQ9F0U7_TEGGR|nr:hypothetical protein KUTeg_011413 [Tegillarca granosa]